MPNLGAHVSTAGGLHTAFERASTATCHVVQIFSKNQKQWRAKPLAEAEIEQFRQQHQAFGGGPLLVHASYLINLASPDDTLWYKSQEAFATELERCQQLDIPYLVIHPGAHTGSGEEAGIARIAAALRTVIAQGSGGSTMILLETTAGQGTALGHRFEQLAQMIDQANGDTRIGICFDTCHAFAAGYDLRDPASYAATFAALDRAVGLERVRAFHLNDSKTDLGSRVDRHTHIGEGFLGTAAFALLMQDHRFDHVPMVLETPKDPDDSADQINLARLRELRQPQHAAE